MRESEPTGCCTGCDGTGAARDESTGGRHWDCQGTGHLHPLGEPCPNDLINGVRRSEYGVHCQHGKHIMIADPDDRSDYPECIWADPWPCNAEGCTKEAYVSRAEADEAAWVADRLAAWRASQ